MTAFFFVASVALRVPFRSEFAYHWDSAQFALAVNEYNVALSQPHAPGYFLYVMLGRLVNSFLGDPHASLVWISVVFGSALAAVMYLLGASMFSRRTANVAALLAMTSPQTWFHSCVALTYIVDAFLVCLTVLWCWRAIERGGTWRDALAIGALMAVVGGVRQQTVFGLALVVLYAFWRFERPRAKKLLAAVVVSAAVGAAWFLSMLKMSGGLALYTEIVRRHAAFNAPATLAGGGLDAALDNVVMVAVSCWNGLVLGVVALAAALLYRAFRLGVEQKRAWDNQHALELTMLAAWIAPMMILGTVVGFTKQQGYVLSYLPAWLLLTAVAVAHLRKRMVCYGVTAALCVVNAAVFVAWPQAWDALFFGVGRSAREIRQHDRQLEQTINAIRSEFDPAEALVCHAHEFYLFGLRHFQLHLPEFDQYQMEIDPTIVTPADKPLMSAREGGLRFVSGLNCAGKDVVLIVVPPDRQLKIFERYFDLSGARLVQESGNTVYALGLEKVGAWCEEHRVPTY